MIVVLWAILALVVGLAAIVVKARLAVPPRPPLPPDVELPDTPLQRTSRLSLGAGLVLAAFACGVVVVHGPEATMADDRVRLLFTALLMAILVALSGASIRLKVQAGREGGMLDERDRAILDRAPAVQGAGTILTLAVWTVGLMVRFHGAGAVPLDYVVLLFWSCLVVHLLALPVGILMGYRRS
ncbi:MAG TPA: hypothetical protein VLH75_06850 [Longimicrobiales bacterium]|nr:hypothetical protein [Longimicrobiales bacterium]